LLDGLDSELSSIATNEVVNKVNLFWPKGV